VHNGANGGGRGAKVGELRLDSSEGAMSEVLSEVERASSAVMNYGDLRVVVRIVSLDMQNAIVVVIEGSNS
jgi:hypothetical protein